MYTTSFNHLNIQLSMILEGTKNLLMSWYFLHNFCNRYKFNIVFNGLQVNNQLIHHFAWFLVWWVINDSMWFINDSIFIDENWLKFEGIQTESREVNLLHQQFLFMIHWNEQIRKRDSLGNHHLSLDGALV